MGCGTQHLTTLRRCPAEHSSAPLSGRGYVRTARRAVGILEQVDNSFVYVSHSIHDANSDIYVLHLAHSPLSEPPHDRHHLWWKRPTGAVHIECEIRTLTELPVQEDADKVAIADPVQLVDSASRTGRRRESDLVHNLLDDGDILPTIHEVTRPHQPSSRRHPVGYSPEVPEGRPYRTRVLSASEKGTDSAQHCRGGALQVEKLKPPRPTPQ
jgi:hypothetical protein